MGNSTNKKVVLVRFDRESLSGFVNPVTFQQSAGIELLRPNGSVAVVPYGEVKMVRFVRDFLEDEGPEQKLFTTRPKRSGLWVRLRFRDDDCQDGLLPNNLLLVDPLGYQLTPPDATSNTQRLFVPRQALAELQVVGVVGSPVKTARRSRKAAEREQIEMFS